MKKTLVALAVLAAGSAQAAEIYNADGSTLELTGRAYAVVETTKQKSTGTDTDVHAYDSRLGFKLRHQVTEGVAAVGKFEFQLTEDDDHGLKNRDVYAGLDFTDAVTVTFGRQTTSFDDLAFRGGFDEYYGFSQQLEDRGRENGIIKATSANINGFVGSASYQFLEGDVTGLTLAGSYDADFGLGLSAGYFDYKQSGNKDHATGYNVGASYAFGDAKVGVDYSSEEVFNKDKADAYRLGGEYNIDAYRLYAGYGNVDNKPAAGGKTSDDGFYAGVAYAFGAKTTIFAEVASYDKEGAEDQDFLGLGLNVNF
ncbi:porin [Vibrio mexicanus]|uniref:porin n=1 Tax=Vibrio mexicanus TaxID=1004326 RepID=UPI00063CA56C|nr:porin [Vibrio mexicanus]